VIQEGSAFTPQITESAASGILWLIPALPIVASGMIALMKTADAQAVSDASDWFAELFRCCCLCLPSATYWSAGERSGGAPRPSTSHGSGGRGACDLGGSLIRWQRDAGDVCFVGLLIFIYSTGYMAHDENLTRFFCFLSLLQERCWRGDCE